MPSGSQVSESGTNEGKYTPINQRITVTGTNMFYTDPSGFGVSASNQPPPIVLKNSQSYSNWISSSPPNLLPANLNQSATATFKVMIGVTSVGTITRTIVLKNPSGTASNKGIVTVK
jgi:hypothetical protein